MTRIANREELISTIRRRVVDGQSPRLVTMLIVALSGAVAFGASVAALRLGVDEMALRYPGATLVGYLAFIGLIRVWIAAQDGQDMVPDPLDMADTVHAISDVLPASTGGAPDSGWFDFGLDLEEAWFVLLAFVCALGGLIAIAYVVYIAPLLLAEVVLDAVLVSTMYRRLRREDIRWWAASVFRRTCVPAMILMIFMGATGWALQQIAPDARSIGGVVRELLP